MYLGLVDGFERSAELDPGSGIFCEYKPLGEYLPVCFRFDDEFLHSPPPQVSLYFTENGVAIYVSDFLRADQSTKVLFQQRFGGSLLTLLRQGKLQLSLENETGFHLIGLDDCLEDSTPFPLRNGFLLQGENAFAHISHEGKLLLCSEGKVLSHQNGIEADVPFHDSGGHIARMKWQDGTLESCSIRTSSKPTETTFALALFESALIGADTRPFLADNLAEKADKLKKYLGNYRSVVLTSEQDKIGLVYERKPRVYDVRYFRVTLSEQKISNITPL